MRRRLRHGGRRQRKPLWLERSQRVRHFEALREPVHMNGQIGIYSGVRYFSARELRRPETYKRPRDKRAHRAWLEERGLR